MKNELSSSSRLISINGTTLNVRVMGEGPDVLLVHGFPDDGEVWRKQVPALLAAGYRLIVPDLRGCGESSMPESVSDYSLDNLVTDLIGVLDSVGADKVRLVAHDWGAVIAWQLCMRHPKVNCAPMITGVVGLGGVANAFEALGNPEQHAKILIDPRSAATTPSPVRLAS